MEQHEAGTELKLLESKFREAFHVLGRFGFVEMRSEELASSAMQLDKVDVCGRQINVGRPKGYVEPPGGAAPAATLNAAQVFAASLARRASTVLLLENMLLAYQLHDDRERNDVSFEFISYVYLTGYR